MTQIIYTGTGHRKNSIARVRLIPGSGKILINGINGDLYLQSDQDLSDEHIIVTNAYGQVVNFNLTQENSGLFRIQLEKPQTGIYYLISQNIREKLIIK